MKQLTKQTNDGQDRRRWGWLGARLTSTIAVMATAGLAIVAALVTGNGVAQAWGPNRPTFTMANPSTYVTFDSITDNPDWGDERAFTVIKDITASGEQNDGSAASGQKQIFANQADFVDGHSYMVKMFIHNNASANFNLVAKNTRLMTYVPSSSGDSAMIQGQIAADNCGANLDGNAGSACAFWDEAYIKSSDKSKTFKVAYVPGSARYYNNIKDFTTSGFTLSDNLTTTTGAKLGYDQMDGNIQGCFQYSGYATFIVKAVGDQNSFRLVKQVQKDGSADDNWSYSLDDVKPGETLKYRIYYENNGQTQQSHVILRDMMAKKVTIDGQTTTSNSNASLNYVADSSYLFNGNHAGGLHLSQNDWIDKGLDIGSYGAQTNAYVTYKVTVPSENELQCGDNTFDNVAFAITDNAGTKMSNSIVTVHRDCAPDTPNPTPTPETTTTEPPKAPNAGVGIRTAVLSTVLFLIGATITVRLLVRSNRKANNGQSR